MYLSHCYVKGRRYFLYLVVEEDIDDEGASDRGACLLREGGSDSKAFADGEEDKIQQGDRELVPQIHSYSPFQEVWMGPCVADVQGREGTLLDGDIQA